MSKRQREVVEYNFDSGSDSGYDSGNGHEEVSYQSSVVLQRVVSSMHENIQRLREVRERLTVVEVAHLKSALLETIRIAQIPKKLCDGLRSELDTICRSKSVS